MVDLPQIGQTVMQVTLFLQQHGITRKQLLVIIEMCLANVPKLQYKRCCLQVSTVV